MLTGIAPWWGNSGQKKSLFDDFFDLLREKLKT